MDWICFFIIVSGGILFYYVKEIKSHNRNMVDFNNSFKILTTDEVDSIIDSATESFVDVEEKYNYVYKKSDMPLGRASAFLNYHKTSIYDEEPSIFLCKRSSKDNEFREYGCIIGRNGIYVSKENPDNYKQKEKQAALPGEDNFYSFNGLSKVLSKGNKIILTYFQPNKRLDTKKKLVVENPNERELFLTVFKAIIVNQVGFTMLKNNVIESIDQLPETVTKVFGNYANAYRYYNKKVAEQDITLEQRGYNTAANIAGLEGVKPQFEAFYAENKNYMNGSRGHGYAAEYGNNAVDRFLMRDVENAAQQLENGHQIKNGADRVVNGAQIQTKYYQSASESIGAAFEHKQAKYTYFDSTGTEKMMEIEVPRDQYSDALRLMQKRIDSGQVPNVEPGEDARNYVRKGFFTYDQSYCIAQSGTIESLKVDALSGAVCCSQVAGITAAIVFAISIWNGQSAEEALKQSLGTGLKVLGKGTLIYTLTMQLSRDSFANLIEGKNIVNEVSKGYFTIDNPVFNISENLASKISSSGIAQTEIGEVLGLENITGKEVIGGAVTVAIVFGPDIARALVGRISPKQLAKNASVGLAGMIGGIIGQSLIPIPIVGAMVGSITTSFMVKKTLDAFIEDDAKEMFRILKEEFLDTTMLAGLNPEEFEEVVSLTVGYKKLPKQLQKMYQSQEYRRYAHEAIMLPAINNVLSKRQVITNDVFVQELKLLADVN